MSSAEPSLELRPRPQRLAATLASDPRWVSVAAASVLVLVLGAGIAASGETPWTLVALGAVGVPLTLTAVARVTVPRIVVTGAQLRVRSAWGLSRSWPIRAVGRVIRIYGLRQPWWAPEPAIERRAGVIVLDREGRRMLAAFSELWTPRQLAQLASAFPDAGADRLRAVTVIEVAERYPDALPHAVRYPLRAFAITVAVAVALVLALALAFLP